MGSGGDLRGEELSSLRAAIDREMTQAVAELASLLDSASPDDLRRPSVGTRWTNRQLLFHMVFGYCVVRSLMPLVHTGTSGVESTVRCEGQCGPAPTNARTEA